MTSIYSPTFRSSFDFARLTRGTEPAHKLIFATLPRSGSHYICQQFFATGYAGLPLEYFNPAHWDRWRVRVAAEASGRSPVSASHLGEASTSTDQTLPRASDRLTLDALLRRRTGPTGCFSAKLHYSHLKQLLSVVSDTWLHEAHWVRIERLDVIAQAVSLDIAVQTGSWIYTQKAWRTPTYHFPALRRRVIQLLRDRHAWKKFFQDLCIQPRVLCYESFLLDPKGTAATVLDGFGLRKTPLAPDVVLPLVSEIQSQSSVMKIEWAERFANDLDNELQMLVQEASEQNRFAPPVKAG